MILRAQSLLPLAQPPIADGALVIHGGRIQAVGRWGAIRSRHPGAVVDLGRVTVLPGLINGHCHLDYTNLHGYLTRPKTFPDWIKELVTLKSHWSYSDYAASWLHGARMLLRSGVTTVADIEAVPELLPEVWQATPLRVISFAELINVRHWDAGSHYAHETEARLTTLRGSLGRLGLSPHAPYTASPGLVRAAALVARRNGWRLTTHVAESIEEFDLFVHERGPLFDWLSTQCAVSELRGRSPVRHLAELGLLGRDFLAVHGNYLAPGDAELLGQHGASVAHCPRSHAYFQHQPFPLPRLRKAGVNVCLGTDSLASVTGAPGTAMLDFFEEMRDAARAHGLSPEAVVRMATIHGAKALGREHELGAFTRGALADVIVLPAMDTSDPYAPVLAHIGEVMGAMIAGRWVLPPPMAQSRH